MRQIIKMEPSSAFAEKGITQGDVFSMGTSRKYLVLQTDPWFVYCIRYYWWDSIIGWWYAFRDRK